MKEENKKTEKIEYLYKFISRNADDAALLGGDGDVKYGRVVALKHCSG